MRVGMIALGCAKNLVDSEIMLGTLIRDGIEITNDAADADVVIVNTCSFIDTAQEESVNTILESDEVRQAHHRGQGLVVAGCLPQRFRDELPALLPEVDAFMGIDQVGRVTDIVRQALQRRATRLAQDSPGASASRQRQIVRKLGEIHRAQGTTEPGAASSPARTGAGSGHAPEPIVEVNRRPKYIPDFATPRFRLTPRHFAYVKIAEGCNHPCSFCIIPRMRGSHRSRPLPDIVREARQLIDDGAKELNLISQDSTYYGLDLRPNASPAIASPQRFTAAARSMPADSPTLCALIRELNALPGDFWIRILYTHPAHWTDELIRTIAESPKVARYVDIPLQHIHENMLERMRRETSREHIEDLLARIRAGIPGIALRTTFIVGFPGETKACFDSLLEFVRRVRFERLGVFTYSREDGTRAGGMAGQVTDAVKSKRRDLVMAAQREIAREIGASFVGRTIRVLVEGVPASRESKAAEVSSWEHGLIRSPDEHRGQLRGRLLVARGESDAPDIDGRIYVRGNLPLGEFARVRIVGHTDYDLVAEPES